MIVGIAIVIIIVAYLLNMFAGAVSYMDIKQKNKENLEKNRAQWAQQRKDISKKYDVYYDKNVDVVMPWFYSDGSLKKDPDTGKTYPKGQYRATSAGLDCNLKQAGPNVKRAPRN